MDVLTHARHRIGTLESTQKMNTKCALQACALITSISFITFCKDELTTFTTGSSLQDVCKSTPARHRRLFSMDSADPDLTAFS